MQKTNLTRLMLFFAVVVSGLFNSTAQAEDRFRLYKDYDRYRYLPRLPEAGENPPPLPKTEQKVEGSEEILVDELKGIIFVDHPDKVRETAEVSETVGVYVDASSQLGMIRSRAYQRIPQSYIGQAISIRKLNELVRDTIVFYRKCDQPVVDIAIPEQDITDGVVQIIVTEGRIGKVCVKGSCYFDNQVLADQLQFCPGCPVYESHLQRELRWLYRNPFRTIELELTPGEERGQTDVTFNVKDKSPWRYYTGYEDTGTRATGLERVYYGVNWYNALDKDHTFGYQYTADPNYSRFHAHSAFYSMALQNRDIISIYGTLADYKASIPQVGEDPGKSWQIMGRWYRELQPNCGYEHSITAGFDFKRVLGTVDFIFPGVTLGSDFDIFQLLLGYSGHKEDAYGSWRVGADGYWSPGGFTGQNDNVDFQGTRPDADEHYAYVRSFFERRLWMPYETEFVVRATGQLAEGNLMPTEQLGFGGYNSVRGYDQYAAVGDSGYFVNFEWWSPTVKVGQCNCKQGELRGLVFFDTGNAQNHTLQVGEDGNVITRSVGVGFRYDLDPHVQVRFDYGHQLKDIPQAQPYENRVHLGAVLAY